jgi:hypothetical protein
MEFEHAAIALLASMVLVLAGLVGWLYWQQTRLAQNMNNIVMVVGELATARAVPEVEAEVQPEAEAPVEQEEDDRVSVDQETSKEPVVIEGPPADDGVDGLESKSKKELQDILTKKGIPFGKGDNKNALISLLKATA